MRPNIFCPRFSLGPKWRGGNIGEICNPCRVGCGSGTVQGTGHRARGQDTQLPSEERANRIGHLMLGPTQQGAQRSPCPLQAPPPPLKGSQPCHLFARPALCRQPWANQPQSEVCSQHGTSNSPPPSSRGVSRWQGVCNTFVITIARHAAPISPCQSPDPRDCC